MDRAFSSGAAGSPPSAPASPSVGYATSGNPSTATPATKPGAYWYHMITEELLAIIAAAGITNDKATLTQVASAIQSGKLFSASAAGTADALTAGFTPAVATLKDGMALYVRAALANATATPTFTPNSGVITAKTIVKGAGAALVAGDIAGAGHWIELQYDLSLDKWVLLNPATGVASSLIPQNSQSAAYTLVLADAGRHLLHPSADTTARIFTIPANASVAFPIGTAITFVNQASAGVVTIAINTDTMRLAGAGTTGSRTLAANGIATALKITATEWIISGTGLT